MFRALIFTLILLRPATGLADELKPGKPFPGLTLSMVQGGKATSLSSLAGQKVMLHVFASW